MAVLGLSDSADGDWARLRGLQYATLRRVTPLRIATQAAAALAAAMLLLGKIPFPILLGWMALVGLTHWYAGHVDRSLTDVDRRHVTREEVKVQMLGSIGNALVWALPLCGLGPFIEPQTQVKVWTVLAMLMAASVILLPAVPLSTLLFTAIVGGSAITWFVVSGSFDMAAIAVLFVCIVTIGAIEGARRYVTAKIAEAGMVEKDEVVSLLLREFEEGEADWLWQIDTSRRVRSVSPRFEIGRAHV